MDSIPFHKGHESENTGPHYSEVQFLLLYWCAESAVVSLTLCHGALLPWRCRSGSMTGFRLLLAKIVAQQLLLSLSQNDFFLVFKVHRTLNFVSSAPWSCDLCSLVTWPVLHGNVTGTPWSCNQSSLVTWPVVLSHVTSSPHFCRLVLTLQNRCHWWSVSTTRLEHLLPTFL